GCPCITQVLERYIYLFTVNTMQHSVPMAKGTTLNVLPCQSNRRSTGKNSCAGQRLSLAPINATLRTKRCATTLENTRQLWMSCKMLRPGQKFLIIGCQLLL